jgi:hypothetical protein
LSKLYYWVELTAPAEGWIAPVGGVFADVEYIVITNAQMFVRDADGILTDIAALMPNKSILNLGMDLGSVSDGFSAGIISSPISDIKTLKGRFSGLWQSESMVSRNIWESIRDQTEADGKVFSLAGAQIEVYQCSGHAPGLLHFGGDLWRTIGDNEPVTLAAGDYAYPDIAHRVIRGRITSAQVSGTEISFEAEDLVAALAEPISTTTTPVQGSVEAQVVPIVIGTLTPSVDDPQALVPLVATEYTRAAKVFRYADEVESDIATEVFFVERGGKVGRVRDMVFKQYDDRIVTEPVKTTRDLGGGLVAISGTTDTATSTANRTASEGFVLAVAEQAFLIPEGSEDAITRDISITHEPPIIQIGDEIVRLAGNGDYPRAAQFEMVDATGFANPVPYTVVPHERGHAGTTPAEHLAGTTMTRLNSQGNNDGTLILWQTAPDYIREFRNRRNLDAPAAFGDANNAKRAGISGSVAGVLKNSERLAWGELTTEPPLIFSARDVGPEFYPDGTKPHDTQRWASRLWTLGYSPGDGDDHWFSNTVFKDYCDGRFQILCPPPKADYGELVKMLEHYYSAYDDDKIPRPWVQVRIKGRARIRRQVGETAPPPSIADAEIWKGAFALVRVEGGVIAGRANLISGQYQPWGLFNDPRLIAYLPGDGVLDLLEFDETRYIDVASLSADDLWVSRRRSDDPYEGLIDTDNPIPIRIEIETNAVYPGGEIVGTPGSIAGRKKHTSGSGVVSPEVEIDAIVISFVTRKELDRGDLLVPAAGVASAAVSGVSDRADIAALRLAQRIYPSMSVTPIGGTPSTATQTTLLAQGRVQDIKATPRGIARDIVAPTRARLYYRDEGGIYITTLIDSSSRTLDGTLVHDDFRIGENGLTDIRYSYTDSRDLITGIEIAYRMDSQNRPGRTIRITHNSARGDDGRDVDLTQEFIPSMGFATSVSVLFMQDLFAKALAKRGSESVLTLTDKFTRTTGQAFSRALDSARIRAVELVTIKATAPADPWLSREKLATYDLGNDLRGILPDRIIDYRGGVGVMAKRRYIYDHSVAELAEKKPTITITLQELPR